MTEREPDREEPPEERLEILRGRIDEVEGLTSPPVSLDRILGLASDSEARLVALGEAIAMDPAITARVLRLANSAYFGFPRAVESIEEAVMVIGFRNVRNLAACAAVAPVFAGEGDGIDRCALWRHSCGVAEAARLLAAHQSADDGQAYVAGLLHDLGQVVLAEALGDDYARVLEKETRPEASLAAHERAQLGGDHAWAGALLCERWRLPTSIVSAIRGHHVRGPGLPAEAARVALAEYLAEQEGLCDPLDPEPARPDGLLPALGLSSSDLDALARALHERREAIDLVYRETSGSG